VCVFGISLAHSFLPTLFFVLTRTDEENELFYLPMTPEQEENIDLDVDFDFLYESEPSTDAAKPKPPKRTAKTKKFVVWFIFWIFKRVVCLCSQAEAKAWRNYTAFFFREKTTQTDTSIE
jgi:hypothetical protein